MSAGSRERRAVALLDNLADWVVLVDHQGIIQFVNRGDEPNRTNLEGERLDQLPFFGPALAAAVLDVSAGQGARELETHPSEAFRVTVSPAAHEGAGAVCLVARRLARDRASLERCLEKEKLQIAVEATGLGLWSWDVATKEVVWNEQMKRLTGGQPVNFAEWFECVAHPEERTRTAWALARMERVGTIEPVMARIVRRDDGETRWVVMSGRVLPDRHGEPAIVVGATLDITEYQTATARLVEAQRMESVGHLTAGVAHNFNNTLMVITSCLEALASSVREDDLPWVRDALLASRQASETVRQLMTYAGQGKPGEPRIRDVTTLLHDLARTCRRAIETSIELRVMATGPAPARCETGALEEVFTNLILNARDALIDARTEQAQIEVEVRTESSFGEGWISVLVRDNGPGIAEDLRNKIFEPFFSTKADRGTGLGLASCQAIVARHGGQIACRCANGGGTEFLVLLPMEELAELAPQSESPSSPVAVALRVLLVEDEPAIRRVVALGLERRGMVVVHASDAEELTRALAENSEFDVVLLDRSLGAQSGRDLVQPLRAALPRARLCFFTGQHINAEEASLVDAVIQKPIRIQVLADALLAPSK